jgi:Putative zinc-finger/HEAT repeats
MNCEEMQKSIPLYYYGELPLEEEEAVEDHLDVCEPCRGVLERHRALAMALDRRETAVPDGMIEDCRDSLMDAIRAGASPAIPVAVTQPRTSLSDRFSALMAALWGLRQPIGAVALLAVGYFSAQFTGGKSPRVVSGDPAEAPVARVRSVQPDAAGHVRISLEEVRNRVVSGRMEDDNIQRLLMAATREESDPGVRVESVDLLKDHAASADVRAALLNSAAHDGNPGVRMKALEGLKSFAADGEVRKTLAQILLKDDNPGVRIQAIDMLTSHRDASVVGVLQNMVDKEDNSYVRWRCEKALKEMNASVGTF